MSEPFLTIASLLLLTHATKARATRHLTTCVLAAGICLGALSYNHIIGVLESLSLRDNVQKSHLKDSKTRRLKGQSTKPFCLDMKCCS